MPKKIFLFMRMLTVMAVSAITAMLGFVPQPELDIVIQRPQEQQQYLRQYVRKYSNDDKTNDTTVTSIRNDTSTSIRNETATTIAPTKSPTTIAPTKSPATIGPTNIINDTRTNISQAPTKSPTTIAPTNITDDTRTNISQTNNSQTCECLNCEEDKICGGLWRGVRYSNEPGNDVWHTLNIHIVVSHCSRSLESLDIFINLARVNVKSIHIISKCGFPVTGIPKDLEAISTIEVLPNVGRCDHAYAHYLASILPGKNVSKNEEDNSVVFFLKDSMNLENIKQGRHFIRKWNDIYSMTRIALSSNGFSCGLFMKPNSQMSVYHQLSELRKTKMDQVYEGAKTQQKLDNQTTTTMASFMANYSDLGSFVDELDIERPFPSLVQVCTGGVFAASVRNIKKIKMASWEAAEKILSRGDNIEEGHYMERSWGMLLANSLEQFQIDAFNEKSKIDPETRWQYKGVLINDTRL